MPLARRAIEAHFIGGLGGFFPPISAGTRRLETQTEKIMPGVDARHWLQVEWKGARNQIIANAKRTGQKPLVILGGHSKGAQKAIFIAKDLEKAGLGVFYLAGIDATALFPGESPMAVPPNVGFTDEFWSTIALPFNAPLISRKLAPSGRLGGKYVYPKNWGEDRYQIHEIRGTTHIGVASAQQTQSRILDRIDEVVP
jgi:hypothetical protein